MKISKLQLISTSLAGVAVWTYKETIWYFLAMFLSMAISPYIIMSPFDDKYKVTSKVLAKIKNKTFIGSASGALDGTGIIEMTSLENKEIKCLGNFKYVSRQLLSGEGTINCNDGSIATFNFKGLNGVSGYGFGTSNLGPVTFTYGLSPDESSQYIKMPVSYIEKYY